MSISNLTQDEVIQILDGLRVNMEVRRGMMRREGYDNYVTTDAYHTCQTLFDEFWLLLDATSRARLDTLWYAPRRDCVSSF